MTGRTIKAKRKRYPSDDRDSDRRLRPGHHFRDIGQPCSDEDYKPRISGDPDQALALIFTQLGRDYGGTLPADFVPPAARAGR
ncbi:hypothetical protein [Nitrobacter sp. JJSN]|uniref:hypothetical protein n=1 Tax=Nitrobacter sp. JJSN TaxID=3453033 RepID=UPI003F75DFE2